MSSQATHVKEEPGGAAADHVVKEEAQLMDHAESVQEPPISENISSGTASVKRELVELEIEGETCLDSGSPSHSPDMSDIVCVKQETCLDGSVSEGTCLDGGVSEGTCLDGGVSEGTCSDGGVSEGTCLDGGISEGTVKDELVLGPECVQQLGRHYSAPAAWRACAVRVPRAPALEARLAAAGRDPDELHALRFMECEACKSILCLDVSKPHKSRPLCYACGKERALKLLNDLKGKRINKTSKSLRQLQEKVSTKCALEKSYTCEVCKQIFSSLKIYRKHSEEHAGIKRKQKGLQTEPNSDAQTDQHSDIVLVKYFDDVKTKATVDGVSVMYYCEFCQEKFTTVDELKAHKQSHFAIWKYSCSVCNKRYRRRSNLNIHRYSCHIRAPTRYCDACKTQKALKQFKNLCKSRKIVCKPYYCELCNYGST